MACELCERPAVLKKVQRLCQRELIERVADAAGREGDSVMRKAAPAGGFPKASARRNRLDQSRLNRAAST